MNQSDTVEKQGQHASLEQQIAINAQYIKDLSFENPRAPKSLLPSKEKPSINLNISIDATKIQEETFEVALKIKATASSAEGVIFVAEVVYAGLFTLKNIAEQEREAALLIYGPNILFPFARRIMADVSRDGGFPPLMLEPVDFARLYIERKSKQS